MRLDLREWMKKVEALGELKQIDGANWDLEIGCVSELNFGRKYGPVLLFDHIKDYPKGYRVMTCSNITPATLGLTFNLPTHYNDPELVKAFAKKLPEWESEEQKFPPQVVDTGPVMENVYSGNEVDLFRFPAPKWHELDGGRYLGTGHGVVTRDPETGVINVGTYRIMIHDKKTTGLHMSPGRHGRIQIEKYHAKGEPAPVAVSIGHNPLVFRIASSSITSPEYNYMGAILGEPVKVIKEEVTGLPIPAESELVIAGWCPPNKTLREGPFGEFPGYYGGETRPHQRIIEVERVYHRNDPIILGNNHIRTRNDGSYFFEISRSAMLYNDLKKNGIPDVKGVWVAIGGTRFLIIISVKQRYAGHAKQAAFIASQTLTGAYMNRYVIVVDEDIDPSNMEEVLWAMCTRSDPEKDIDIIRGGWSGPLDPVIRKPTKAFFNSRAIIDACKPFDWIDEFPTAIEFNPELEARVKEKWGKILKL